MLVQYIISMIMFFFLPVCPCTQCYIQYDFTNKLYSHGRVPLTLTEQIRKDY